MDTYRGKMTSFPPLSSCNLHWIGAILISDKKKKPSCSYHVHHHFPHFPHFNHRFPLFLNLPGMGLAFLAQLGHWTGPRQTSGLPRGNLQMNMTNMFACIRWMDGWMDGCVYITYIYIIRYIYIYHFPVFPLSQSFPGCGSNWKRCWPTAEVPLKLQNKKIWKSTEDASVMQTMMQALSWNIFRPKGWPAGGAEMCYETLCRSWALIQKTSLPCFPALTKFPWLWQQLEKMLTNSWSAAEAAKQEDLKIDWGCICDANDDANAQLKHLPLIHPFGEANHHHPKTLPKVQLRWHRKSGSCAWR